MRRTGRIAATITATAVALAGAVVGGDAAVAALFSSSANRATGAFTTATLQPVSNVGVTWACPGGGAGGYTATITWNASPSPFTQSYVVEWAASAGGPWSVLSTTTSTAAQDPSIPRKTDRWWRVSAASYGWRSAPVGVAGTAPNPNC